MDVCFEFLILDKQPLNSLESSQKTITWEGIVYPQEPRKYIWGKYTFLVEVPVPQHLYQYLPEGFHGEDWTCLSIRGQTLDNLELEINGATIDWEGKTLMSLMELILKPQRKWVTIFEWKCDKIDKVYYLNIDGCILQIQQNLRKEKIREGFIVMFPLLVES
jgi:hypothetical protein